MPWLIFRDADMLWLKTRCRNQWTNETKSAAKFKSREEAEHQAQRFAVPGVLHYIELSGNDIYRSRVTPRGALSTQERRQEQTRLAEEAAERERDDLPYRMMAVRLLFGQDMPDGIVNPYYVGSACVVGREQYRKRTMMVDALAGMLKSGEAQPPRFDNGAIALPLPRKSQDNPLRYLAIESPDSNWIARVNRKGESRRG
jgi:hypothetical protein